MIGQQVNQFIREQILFFDPRNPDKIFMTSGNDIFCYDNIWDEKNVKFYFEPKVQE